MFCFWGQGEEEAGEDPVLSATLLNDENTEKYLFTTYILYSVSPGGDEQKQRQADPRKQLGIANAGPGTESYGGLNAGLQRRPEAIEQSCLTGCGPATRPRLQGPGGLQAGGAGRRAARGWAEGRGCPRALARRPEHPVPEAPCDRDCGEAASAVKQRAVVRPPGVHTGTEGPDPLPPPEPPVPRDDPGLAWQGGAGSL